MVTNEQLVVVIVNCRTMCVLVHRATFGISASEGAFSLSFLSHQYMNFITWKIPDKTKIHHSDIVESVGSATLFSVKAGRDYWVKEGPKSSIYYLS